MLIPDFEKPQLQIPTLRVTYNFLLLESVSIGTMPLQNSHHISTCSPSPIQADYNELVSHFSETSW